MGNDVGTLIPHKGFVAGSEGRAGLKAALIRLRGEPATVKSVTQVLKERDNLATLLGHALDEIERLNSIAADVAQLTMFEKGV